ncbi:MAG: hypothetical protein ACOVSR_08245, partial [Bacteroidia bacterium]
MKNKFLKISFLIFLCNCYLSIFSQSFTLHDGDTINVTIDGKKQGFWRYYWPNDDLKYEVFYENNEKQGI